MVHICWAKCWECRHFRLDVRAHDQYGKGYCNKLESNRRGIDRACKEFKEL